MLKSTLREILGDNPMDTLKNNLAGLEDKLQGQVTDVIALTWLVDHHHPGHPAIKQATERLATLVSNPVYETDARINLAAHAYCFAQHVRDEVSMHEIQQSLLSLIGAIPDSNKNIPDILLTIIVRSEIFSMVIRNTAREKICSILGYVTPQQQLAGMETALA
jgi:hypothetical protein